MSLEMAPFDKIAYEFLFVFHCIYGRIFIVSEIKQDSRKRNFLDVPLVPNNPWGANIFALFFHNL